MQYLLIKLLVTLNIIVLKGNLLIREEHEVINKDLSSLFQRLLRVNGTIRCYLEDELIVVGLLLNTIGLYCELHITDWSVDRINGNHVNICAELTVLIRGNVTTTFIYGQIYLH